MAFRRTSALLCIAAAGFGCGGGHVASDAAASSDGAVDDGLEQEGDSAGDADDETFDASNNCPPAVQACPTMVPSYATDVAPLIEQRCNTCHNVNVVGGPWPLAGYDNVYGWKGLILSDLYGCTMPPTDEAGSQLTEAERELLVAWLVCGAPNN